MERANPNTDSPFLDCSLADILKKFLNAECAKHAEKNLQSHSSANSALSALKRFSCCEYCHAAFPSVRMHL